MSDGETDIRPLSETTVQRIAAGEIVERPASVVKELVENSLDADATRIEVNVEAGGTDRIAVSDDGIGMNEANARIAVQEHTTSKIRDVSDLESGVTTLGFRGEALYTIGAVSRLTLRTKPRGGESGTELRLVGGEVEGVGPAGRPEGTTVEVSDLFFNTPAREKYLKADSTEFSHVSRVVTQYALANPDVAFALEHDGREVFSTTGRGDLRSAVLSVYGREVATAMIPVEDEARDETANGDAVGVSGYVSHPETTRSTREYASTYVNGRYVRSSVVREAVLDAYGNQLAPDRYPFTVLFLDLPGDSVDVNIHPRKWEVRFGDEGRVRDAVRSAVEAALLDHGLVRSSAPRGRSAPAEATVEPDGEQRELGDERDPTGAASDTGGATDRTRSTDPDADGGTNAPAEATEGAEPKSPSPKATRGGGEPAASSPGRSAGDAPSDAEPSEPERSAAETPDSGPSTVEPNPSSPTPTARDSAGTEGSREGERVDSRRKFRPATESGTLGDGPTTGTEFDRLPRMRVLGQLQDTYVVAETPDGLVLVDQHAADERVNYERLCERFAGDTTTQVLAAPVELELTAREAALFEDYREALARLGFHAARTDDRTVEVTTVPAVFEESLSPDLLRDVLGEFVSTDSDERAGTSAEAMADALISDLACYPSITGNTSLREGDVVSLLSALDDCENPYACPHGRPVVIEFGEREIEERFERDYPGHVKRRNE